MNHDETGQPFGQAEGGAHEVQQAFVGDAAERLEQVAVEAEVGAQHLGDGEGNVAVGNREEDGLGEQGPEELNLFLMAGRTEPAALAGEREQVVFLAVVAADAGEPMLEVPAVQKLVHYLGDDGPQETVTGLVAFLVDRLEGVEMPGEALPEWRCPGPAGTIDLCNHALHRMKGDVSNSGTPPEKVGEK